MEDIATVAIGLGDQIDSLEFQQQLKKIAVRDDHYFFIENTDILLKRCKENIMKLLCRSSVPITTNNETFVGFVAEISPLERFTYSPDMVPFSQNTIIENVGIKAECTNEV